MKASLALPSLLVTVAMCAQHGTEVDSTSSGTIALRGVDSDPFSATGTRSLAEALVEAKKSFSSIAALQGGGQEIETRQESQCSAQTDAVIACLPALGATRAEACVDCVLEDLEEGEKRRTCAEWRVHVCTIPTRCGCGTCTKEFEAWNRCGIDGCGSLSCSGGSGGGGSGSGGGGSANQNTQSECSAKVNEFATCVNSCVRRCPA